MYNDVNKKQYTIYSRCNNVTTNPTEMIVANPYKNDNWIINFNSCLMPNVSLIVNRFNLHQNINPIQI